jgi:hypothetical protein
MAGGLGVGLIIKVGIGGEHFARVSKTLLAISIVVHSPFQGPIEEFRDFRFTPSVSRG